MYSCAVLTNFLISGEVLFCQMNCPRKLCSPKISLQIDLRLNCSLSSIEMKITPLSAISIDDNELYNLKMICDEIYGANCFVSNISWQRTFYNFYSNK